METSVIQIEYKNGRKFRVFCANASQNKKLLTMINSKKEEIANSSIITNGLHTLREFNAIVSEISKPS